VSTTAHRHALAQAALVEPNADAARLLAGIAYLESSYGRASYQCPVGLIAWAPGQFVSYGTTRPATVPTPARYNMGAIQAGRGWQGEVLWALDSSPQDDGSTRWYATSYRAYPDEGAGWTDLRRVAFGARPTVYAAACAGSVLGVSRALRETRYYEGFGATPQERIDRHTNALALGVWLARYAETGAQLPQTLRQGSRSADVVDWQRIVGVAQDGAFGAATHRATIAWQRSRYLSPDGVVGPRSWARAAAEMY
jgi:peptidoglycan hydrolase-like protein with peptidoglycan-binding domain